MGLAQSKIEVIRPFKSIATALAFSPTAEALLFEAKRISERLNASLTLIHAGVKNSANESRVHELLEKVGLQKKSIKLIWKEGKPEKVLLEVCLLEKVDLLILGAIKHETLVKHYTGSVARKISRNPPCSLLLITNPQKSTQGLRKVVVNGLNHLKTKNTIEKACYFALSFDVKKITVVEEIRPTEVKTKIDDNLTLEQAYHEKQELRRREDKRIFEILKPIPIPSQTEISVRAVFGKEGYSISHYAEVKKASLLVMNSPDNKLGFLDRLLPHDLEYVLSDMPCDLLIVHQK
ncbi:MAG: nucleotide-binding universal stress UspA family protein [Vicingaceae bacterium]|jgi:nucleotide-binding universal stress UspA family protein